MYSSRDNWERLVTAVVRKQQIWELFHSLSISTIASSDDDDDDHSNEQFLDNRWAATTSTSVSPPAPPPFNNPPSAIQVIGNKSGEAITRKLFPGSWYSWYRAKQTRQEHHITELPAAAHLDLETGDSSAGVDGGGWGSDPDFSDPFDIFNRELLKHWMQAALALNASRGLRFRYMLDLKTDEEREKIRRMIRAHAQVTRAAVLSKSVGQRAIVLGTTVAPPSPNGDYENECYLRSQNCYSRFITKFPKLLKISENPPKLQIAKKIKN